MFKHAGAYDVLGDYAKSASRREPAEATWRFYLVAGRTKGDPDRLTFSETEELIEMAEDASHRHDFHMANRIERFIEGSGPVSAPRRGSRRLSAFDLADFDDEDETGDVLSKLLAMSLEDTPPDMVKRMIAKHGQRGAVTALVDRIRTSPLGTMLPERMLRELASGIVDSVIATSGRSVHG
jgi:hypothetical protein